MAIHAKEDGVWQQAKSPFIKRNGVWVPIVGAWVKEAGVWKSGFEYDTTASSPPEMSLEIMFNRYIKVGVRLPLTNHDPDLRLIRLMGSRTEMPTTWNGPGYHREADNTWPREEWSNFYFNDGNPAGTGSNYSRSDSSVFTYKQFPINPDSETNLPGGQYYYFAAWSKDHNGNWSVGTFRKIWMPKDANAPDPSTPKVILKEANIQASHAGSAGVGDNNYAAGDLVARDTPRSNGFWFYGNRFSQPIGEQGTPNVKSAKIRVVRKNDNGQAQAKVRLFWHEAHQPSGLPVGDSGKKGVTELGTIGKGESKWFDIPNSYLTHFNNEIKGFGLRYGTLASDFLESPPISSHPRNGEVNVVWEETL